MPIRMKEVTYAPAGADGSAVATGTISFGRPAVITHIKVDYQNQPATTDIVLKNNNTDGATLFTATSTATDIGPKPVGMPGVDEGNAATAATDGLFGGWALTHGSVYVDIAQGDGQTTGDEKVVITLWAIV